MEADGHRLGRSRAPRSPLAPCAVPLVRADALTRVAVVAVDHLCVRRGGRVVVDDLSCTLEHGAVTGLLGPSGSGKSTLIRSLLGIQRVESGTVTVLGAPAGSRALRGRIGYFPQGAALYGDLSVRDNLHYFSRVLDAPASDVDRVLAVVELGARADAAIHRLSGGERARASLAVALLGTPPVLVLDEPTVGLDPVLRRELWETFHALAAGGCTLLVSSHVMDEAARCDKLMLLRGGRLVAVGTPHELRMSAGTDDLDRAFLRLAGAE